MAVLFAPVTSIILAALSVLICVVIIISLIYSNYIRQPLIYTKPIVLRITFTTIIAYILSNSLHLIRNTLSTENPTVIESFNTITLLIWNIAQMFIYLLLMLRLHHAFNGTKYAISKQMYITFIILMVLYSIATIIFIIHKVVFVEEEEKNERVDTIDIDLGTTYAVAVEIIDFIISVVLIVLFTIKMMQVTVDLHNNADDRFINDQFNKLNIQQKYLLDVTAKYFILSFIATLWTQITFVLYLIFWIFINEDGLRAVVSGGNHVIHFIFLVFFYVDGIINPICLYLLFENNDKLYRKWCHGCHSLARLCFRKRTKREIDRREKGIIRQYTVQSDPLLEVHLLQSDNQIIQ